MKKSIFLIFLFLAILQNIKAQEINTTENPSQTEVEKKLFLGLDIVNQYIWRGQAYGGNYITLQPCIEYNFTDNFSFGIWATSNLKKNMYSKDGITPEGYQEFNIYATYFVNDNFSIKLSDYYYPSLDNEEETNNKFFNYGEDAVKAIDLNLNFDFSEIWLPFNVSLSTLIAGNDFKYDENDENPKRNYTSYIEIGYTFEAIFNTFDINTTVGNVLNNKAEYYTYADYNKPSFVNLNLEFSKTFQLNNNISFPISLSYIHNEATKNTEPVGKNFIVTKFTLEY
jgi:hypothetical protein